MLQSKAERVSLWTKINRSDLKVAIVAQWNILLNCMDI